MKQILKFVKGLDPVADVFSGTVYTDIVSMRYHKTICFVIYKGVGTTGTSTITIEACSNVSAGATSAIPFNYQEITSGDTSGAITAATTAGFTLTAGSSQIYVIYVDASECNSSGYGFVRLKAVESVNDPVLGGILIIGMESKDEREVAPTIIA